MEIKTIRRLLLLFMFCLLLSGLTAVPVEWQLSIALQLVTPNTLVYDWLLYVEKAYTQTKTNYPFLLYGYDWLAFAHVVLSILFIGPYKDPVKNIWVIQFGLIACFLIFPTAFIAGYFRGIPFWWQLIDCSFGVIGSIPLLICYRKVQKLTTTTFLNQTKPTI